MSGPNAQPGCEHVWMLPVSAALRPLIVHDVSSHVPFSCVWPPLRNPASTNVDAPPPTFSPPQESDFAIAPPAPPRLRAPHVPTGEVPVSVKTTFAPNPHGL